MPIAGATTLTGQPVLRKPCQQRLCMHLRELKTDPLPHFSSRSRMPVNVHTTATIDEIKLMVTLIRTIKVGFP
jgi:hypothetical protein